MLIVDAAVIHPPASWDPHANELAVEAARQHPDRLAILGNFPLDRPTAASGQLVAMGQVSYRLLEPWPEGSNSSGAAGPRRRSRPPE